MSSRVGAIAATVTLRAPGAWLSGADSRVGSFNWTSLAFACIELGCAAFCCTAADAAERAAVVEALALTMNSRPASEEYSAARSPAAAQINEPARIRDEK